MDIYDWLKVVNDPDDDGLQMIVKIAIRLLCPTLVPLLATRLGCSSTKRVFVLVGSGRTIFRILVVSITDNLST